jgi:hypothetical protein
MKRFSLVILALAALALYSQQPAADANPVTGTVRIIIQRQSRNLVGAAEKMPAEKYSYRPTPEQMTYAALIAHTAESNDVLCAAIGGTEAPKEKLAEDAGKEKIVAALKASFERCTEELAKADDSKLGETVTSFGGRKVPRAAALISLTNTWASHYSMASMHLRLNSILPPTAEQR